MSSAACRCVGVHTCTCMVYIKSWWACGGLRGLLVW